MNKSKLILIVFIVVVCLLGLYFLIQKTTNQNKNASVIANTAKIGYSAWIPGWDETRSLTSINGEAGTKLDQVLPVWYQLDPKGAVLEITSSNKDLVTGTAHQKNIKVTPTLVNSDVKGFDAESVAKMLNGNQGKTIELLVTLAKNKKYDGWDLDLEEVSKDDKDTYTTFVNKLSESLHKNGLTLSVTVHAQEGGDTWSGVLGQDLEGLGKYADQVRIMAYDFHSPNSNPGPITPIIDLEKTITYTKSKVDPDKIVIGLPTYGYDWASDGSAISYQYQETQALISFKKAKTGRDIDSGEIKATYDSHQIWYLDATSLAKLIGITTAHGINKICFWHLGGEDVELWTKI